MNKLAALGILVIVLAVILSASFNFTGYVISTNTVRVGYLPISASLPLFVALDNGYFEQEGLKVDAVRFESSNPIMDSLLLGKLDATGGVSSTTMLLIEEKQLGNFKVAGLQGETSERTASCLIVRMGSGIKGIRDLSSKKLLTGPGLAGKSIVEVFLKSVNMTLSDINLAQMEYSLVVPAFLAGNGDAVFIWEPECTVVMERAGNTSELLIDGPRPKFVIDPYISSGNLMSTDFTGNYPKLAAKFVKAMDRAVDFIEKDEAGSKRILGKYTALDEETALKTKLYVYWKSGEMFGDLQRFADLMLDAKMLKTSIDVTTLSYAG